MLQLSVYIFCMTYKRSQKNKQRVVHNMERKLLKTAAGFQLFLHVTVVLLWLYKEPSLIFNYILIKATQNVHYSYLP